MEFDARTAAVTAVMYICCMIGTWNPYSKGLWPIKTLIALTIIMLPVSYAISYAVLNR